MCGIAGIVGGSPEHRTPALERMTSAQRHRGPDARGLHHFVGCGLGHARLAIVDLDTGEQPMLGPAERTGIVLNGEIYGFRTLRSELTSYGFRTASDTEVVLALYERHGADLAPHVPGMFAFAIWDDVRGVLVAARDRFGEKPLFYARGPDGEFLFASEIRGLLASRLIEPEISRESLALFLRHGYVPPDRTIYRNVHTLPPGHQLVFDGDEVHVERYFELPRVEPFGLGESVFALRELLGQAVERQLVADVPVGAFLSGGLDSSTIVAEASAHREGLRTISFGFAGEMDERPFAREVATLHGTDHTEIDVIDLDVPSMLERMAVVFDEPLADSATLSTYAVSEEARKHVKVVLTGDGADELLAGYAHWYAPLLDMEREPRTSAASRVVLRIAAAVARRTGLGEGPARRLRGQSLRARYPSVGAAHSHLRELCSDEDLAALGLPVPAREPLGDAPGSLDDALRADLLSSLPGALLVKTDRASMAHGLELRSPFLDPGVASFLASLPSSLKLTDTENKALLRSAYYHAWPESVSRRGKQGFGGPVDRWLRDGSLAALTSRCLDDGSSPLHDLLRADGVARVRTRGWKCEWALLSLGLWAEVERGGPDSLRWA